MEGRQAKKTRNPIPDLQSNLVEPRKGEGFVFFLVFRTIPESKRKIKEKRNEINKKQMGPEVRRRPLDGRNAGGEKKKRKKN